MNIQTAIDGALSGFVNSTVVDINKISCMTYLLDSEQKEIAKFDVNFMINKESDNLWTSLVSLSEIIGPKGEDLSLIHI